MNITKIHIQDHTGHTVLPKAGEAPLTPAYVDEQFRKLAASASMGGLGYLATVGEGLSEAEQVRSAAEAEEVASRLGTDTLTFTGQLVGG